MEDSILLSAPCGTLGTLYLVKRKDGEDLQSFPIDAQKVSVGRDYDCDIRLYFSDVSKLHCEITFDLATGQASLHVLGGNGLFHTPADGATKQHKPPSVILLNDRDTFVIRKKVFRFEYPTDNISPEIAGLMSPVVIPSSLPSASPSPVKNWPPNEPSVRRRASHRLSLVPFGKRFVPMSPAKGRRHSTLGLGRMGTPSKSTLNTEVTEEEAEEENEGQEKQEDLVVDVVNGEEGDMVYLEVNEEAIDQPRPPIQLRGFMTPQPARKAPLRNTSVVPRTRVLASIPDRPAMIDFEVETAVKPTETEDTACKSASDPVPAQVAMTTPRGSSSLRKSLLLRSARKAWEENRSPGIDGAIESGAVEVRRKSSSPKYMNRRSLTPGTSPVTRVGAEQAEHDGSEEGESPFGAVNTSTSSSEMDSFAADVSLDIARDTDNHALQVEEEAFAPDNWMEIDESMNEEQISMDAADVSSSSLEEDPIADSANESFDFGGNQELRQNDSAKNKTTANMSDINQRFYTPQPQRIATFQPRRSLANIGGPAVRFERLPSTPQSVPSRSIHRTVPTPGTLGKPARLAVQSVKEEEEETVPSTPARARPSPAVVAEAKRRRETLATPRALPVPPASGFKERIRDTPIGASLVKSTSHPALAFASPESSLDVPPIPSTPMDHLKQRMANLRRQSLNRQSTATRDGQRATVGFALPSTPVRSHTTPSRTQTFNIAATPSFRGMREMLKTPGAAKTPYMRDLKDLFPTTIEEQPTPSLVGVKDMLQEEKRLATPDMGGVRSLFHERLYPKTPAMEGMVEMYELVETEDEGAVVTESDRLLENGQEEQSPRTHLSNASSTLSHRARGVPRGTNKTVPATAQSAPSRIPQRKRKDDTVPVQHSKTSAIKTSPSASRASKTNSSKSSEDATEAVSSHVEGETVNESASVPARSGRAIRATTRSATNMLSESVQVEVPKRGRPRKILNESQSQESGTVPEQSTVSTNIASKRSHASASSRKAAASNEGAGKSQSAPTRRTRTAAKTQSAEKENEPETQRVDDAPKKRSSASTTRKTASSARETVSAPARSTRSRK